MPGVELGQVFVETGKQVVGGHNSSSEEFSSHPFLGVAGIVVVGKLAVGKDVNEHLSVLVHPRTDALEKGFLIASVLQHFDRHDSVEYLSRLELIDVAGDDLQVFDLPLFGLLPNKGSLAIRIGNSGKSGVRISL